MGDLLLQEIQDDIASLSEQMAHRRWPGVTLKSFCGLGGIGVAAAVACAATSPLLMGLGIGGAIVSGVPVVGDAVKDMVQERYDPQSPLPTPLWHIGRSPDDSERGCDRLSELKVRSETAKLDRPVGRARIPCTPR
jgi:hypothetical protein